MTNSSNLFLHISNDEKFIDSAIKLFEEVIPDGSIYLINGKSKDSLVYSKVKHNNILVFPYYSKEYWNVLRENKRCILFIHGLSPEHKVILTRVGNNHTVFINSWGYDIHSTKLLMNQLYKDETLKFIEKYAVKGKFRLLDDTKSFILKKLYKPWLQVEGSEKYMKYVNYMSTVVKEDFDLFAKFYPEETKHIIYQQFNYGGFLPTEATIKERGDNILIGHNAAFGNNHIEAFNLLKNVEIGNKLVYVPLSYGGNKDYINEIVCLGRHYFGENFRPLINFMPLQEYNNILRTIGYAIMNHTTQQAMGNILNLLCQGVMVYMNHGSTAAKALIRFGIEIADISNINHNTIWKPLDTLTQRKNKEIVLKEYSHEALIERTKLLVNTLIKYSEHKI